MCPAHIRHLINNYLLLIIDNNQGLIKIITLYLMSFPSRQPSALGKNIFCMAIPEAVGIHNVKTYNISVDLSVK